MEKYYLLTKLAKCTVNIALKLAFSVFLFFFEKLSLKKGIKLCLGGLKCSIEGSSYQCKITVNVQRKSRGNRF